MAKKVTIGLDIGSSTISVYVEGKGIAAVESNRVAIDLNTKEPVSYGREGEIIARRTPGYVKLVNPMFEGRVSDHEMLEMVLDEMFRELGLDRPEVIISISSSLNEAEINALMMILANVGVRGISTVKLPTACALGSDIDVADNRAFISLNIGAGLSDIGIVKSCVTRFEQTVNYGCNKFDSAVNAFIKHEYNVAVNEDMLADIRAKIGSVHESRDKGKYQFKGRDLVTGLPTEHEITSAMTRRAMGSIANYICRVVSAVVDGVDKELADDVRQRGIIVSGAGALIAGIDVLLRETTGLPVAISAHPTDCVINGIGNIIENRKVFDVLLNEI